MLIGLLCHRAEEDILGEAMAANKKWVDAIYTADPDARTDGDARGPILDQAYEEHGHDHWFLLMHADEVWVTDPKETIAKDPEADGFIVPLRLAFNDQPWDDNTPVLEQCRRFLIPGWPEFRLFHGGPEVRYAPGQHFNVAPSGLGRIGGDHTAVVNHYAFRSPASQIRRAQESWDPGNYSRCPMDADAIRGWLLGGEHYREEVEA